MTSLGVACAQVALFQRGIMATSKQAPATAATAANKQVKKSLVSQLVATKAALGPYKKPSAWRLGHAAHAPMSGPGVLCCAASFC